MNEAQPEDFRIALISRGDAIESQYPAYILFEIEVTLTML